jgi:hypothetical protein
LVRLVGSVISRRWFYWLFRIRKLEAVQKAAAFFFDHDKAAGEDLPGGKW